MKHLIIIGGGFAGNNVIKYTDPEKYRVTLVDKNNYTFFPPLLYQVATGYLEPSSISYPFRKIFHRYPNFRFKMGSLLEILPDQKKIRLDTGELSYDALILSTGTVSNYFGMANVEKNSIPMKTLQDAISMRNYILCKMEEATRLLAQGDMEAVMRKLRVVIAGGGPTGVEISGMLAEMQQSIIIKDYPEFRQLLQKPELYLVDAAPTLLAPMSPKSQQYTLDSLRGLGVLVVLNAQVKDFDGGVVSLADGTRIETENLIWAAGVVSQKFAGLDDSVYGRGRRLMVDAFNAVIGYKDIYAIGDTCLHQSDPHFPDGHPQLAQVALQQGKNLAKNLSRNGDWNLFIYQDRGSMAIIGRNKAVADLGKNIHFNGFLAWLIWIFIHLMSLVNYRNKVITFFNWLTSYFTKDQALRMIIKPNEQQRSLPEQRVD